MSVKRIVTGLRSPSIWREAERIFSLSSGGAVFCKAARRFGVELAGAPHFLQNLAPGLSRAPQLEQHCANGLPQFSQNSASGSFVEPHFEQFILVNPCSSFYHLKSL